MTLTVFPRFGSRRPKATGDVFDILGDLVPWQEAVDAAAAKTAQTGMRNRIINGAFRVNQRGHASGAAAMTVGQYFFDRWKLTAGSGAQPTWSAAPAGQLITLNLGSLQIAQVIERANMPAGRYVLTHAGTAHARVYNSGGSAPAFAATPLVVDLNGLADVVVEFQSQGGTSKTVGFVQLEQIDALGVTGDATPFEVRPLGDELARCQRYYQRHSAPASGGGGVFGSGLVSSATEGRIVVPVPVPLRSAAITVAGVALTIWDGSTAPAVSAINPNTNGSGAGIVTLVCTVSGGLTVGRACQLYQTGTNLPCYLEISAEL